MKAVQPKYDEGAFFYEEQFEGARRTVVWAPAVELQRAVFEALLNPIGDHIEYLFKEKIDIREEQAWDRIAGGILKEDLVQLIRTHDSWFYADSEFQFCVREPEIPGYFAYDDHGLFFIYESEARDLAKILGIEERRAPLVDEKPHWHVRPNDAEDKLTQFKADLVAASIFCEQLRDEA